MTEPELPDDMPVSLAELAELGITDATHNALGTRMFRDREAGRFVPEPLGTKRGTNHRLYRLGDLRRWLAQRRPYVSRENRRIMILEGEEQAQEQNANGMRLHILNFLNYISRYGVYLVRFDAETGDAVRITADLRSKMLTRWQKQHRSSMVAASVDGRAELLKTLGIDDE